MRLEGAEDPCLEQFVRTFRLGPQAPEAVVSCIGGAGKPQR